MPKAPGRSNSSRSGEETEVARLTRDLRGALEQQVATSEVLQVISGSAGDLQPVFAAMLENAVRICDATFGIIYRWDGEFLHAIASHKTPPALAEARSRSPIRPTADMVRTVTTKSVVHIPDLAAHVAYIKDRDPALVSAVELGGVRTFLVVPMFKATEFIGSFSLYRQEVRPFTDKQIASVTQFAPQAVIAIENARLLNELRQRTNDLTEAFEQQTAASEVLQIISSSPGALEPVFAAMLASATRICEAKFGNLFLREGETFRAVAWHGEVENWRREPLIINTDDNPHIPLARLVETKQRVHVVDLRQEAAYKAGFASLVTFVDRGGARTLLIVPMLREHTLIGAIAIYRQEVRPFTAKQIALVENFATQAVIAIENARLLNELRQRTTDLTEALEQQTATSDVLQVISSFPGDLEPVFASMLENAVRICDATFGNIYRWDGEALHIVATHNTPPAFAEDRRRSPYRPYPQSPIGHMVVTKTVVHISDITAEEVYKAQHDPVAVSAVALGGIRTLLGIPLLNKGEMIGAFFLSRQEVRLFTDKQVELVKNFAAQAAVAIENTRLLSELRQSLEQQTATSEVLQVISSSPRDLLPVFASALENATRICEANFGVLMLYENDTFHVAAAHNAPPAFVELRQRQPTIRASGVLGRVAGAKELLQISDCLEDASYKQGDVDFVRFVDLCRARSIILAPMLKEDELIGVIGIYRTEVRPFTDKQIALLTNFAAQAVIAIENARLLNELRQSLEQQTATADVLKVISRSTFDLQKVLDTLVASAAQLCRAERGSITLPKGENYQRVASYGFSSEFKEFMDRHPLAIERGNIVGRVVLEGRTIQIDDVEADPEFTFVEATRLGKARTLLGVPLMRQGKPIGVLVLTRSKVEPFSNRNIELFEIFADQAVIAMENARLVNELRERTEEVERLNQHLEERVADQVGEIERMGRLRRFLPPQVADLIVASNSKAIDEK